LKEKTVRDLRKQPRLLVARLVEHIYEESNGEKDKWVLVIGSWIEELEITSTRERNLPEKRSIQQQVQIVTHN
jgi:hypothetical protein